MDSGSDQKPAQILTSDYSSTSGQIVKSARHYCNSAPNGIDNNLFSTDYNEGVNIEVFDDQNLLEKDELKGITSCDAVQTNGEIFSPDSADVVTVICVADVKKAEGQDKTDKDGCDDYDTHSDSIETLEEESPQDGCQKNLSDSLFEDIHLTNKAINKTDVFDLQTEGSLVPSELLSSGSKTKDSGPANWPKVSIDPIVSKSRPESLSLPRSLQYCKRNRSTSEPQHESSHSHTVHAEGSGGHQRTRSEAIDIYSVKVKGDLSYGDDIMSRSLPHGTITRKGDMIEFVADDLTEKIKSSPMSRADSSSLGSRRSSQRSIASTSSANSASVATSSGVSRSPSSLLTQSPDAAPPIDPGAIMELEMAARRVADNVELMMGNLCNNLHKMSAITVGCSEAYKTSVDITCDSVDSSIKSMYSLMAKCEELSKSLEPIYQIGAQIKEIKRLLDRFEAQLSEKP